ncbi:hypothetical protein NQ317_010829, partial [Molorchus minor]
VYTSVEDLKAQGNLNTDYPLSQLTVCMGFFFVYFLEEISHWIIAALPDEPCTPRCTPKKKLSAVSRTTVTPLDEPEKSVAFIIEQRLEQLGNEAHKRIKQNSFSLDDNPEIIVYDSLSLNSEVAKENQRNLQLDNKNHQITDEVDDKIGEMMFLLAMASPLGVILGLLFTLKINMETKAKSIAVVLLEGLSAGAILYIIFFEVLNREKERRVYRLYRAVCILAGFSMMAFLQYVEGCH